MKCTLVISDWELTSKFFDDLQFDEEPYIVVNGEKCLVDDVRIECMDAAKDAFVRCHMEEP